jgi:CRISPR/Cas system-associated exonuclease Cas4 (RecB family)
MHLKRCFATIQKMTEKQALISVTNLSSYLYCPLSLYQQKVLGYREKLNEAMIRGSIRHNFLDSANKYEENIIVHLPKSVSKEDILRSYSETYGNLLRKAVSDYRKSLAMFDLVPEEVFSQLVPVVTAESQSRAVNVFNFMTENKFFGEELWKNLSPRILTEVRVKSDSLRLKGTVDRVELYGNDVVVPVELKTGKMPRDGVWPSHRVQAVAYMMLLKELYNAEVSKAVIRYLDHGTDKAVVLNPFMELEVNELTEKVFRLFSSEIAPKPCGRTSCSCLR